MSRLKQKIPVGIAAEVDAPGMFDLGEEAFEIPARHIRRYSRKGR